MKNIINSLSIFCVFLFLFSNCKNETKNAQNAPAQGWVFAQNIRLDSFGVIGIAPAEQGTFWISDADNNRLVLIDNDGKTRNTIPNLERPMHITNRDNSILIANYGADNILCWQKDKSEKVSFTEEFDSPSGVDKSGEKIAVADFYNHRIVYFDGKKNKTFGVKGDSLGQLTYPTDVQFANEKIYVADAYNHRIQVFDLEGKPLQIVGEEEKMNATTGVFVNEKNIFATDFENNRILVYDLNGKLQQTISEHLDKPTDILVTDNQLFVANYHGRYLSIFKIGNLPTVTMYECPMKCEPARDKPGTCSVCKMDLKALK